jgi:protease I
MTAAGIEYVDERVVVDGNLITTQEPKDLPEFSRALIEQLARKPLHA